MIIGIYEVDQKLYDSPLIVRKYFQNNQCVLGYSTAKTLIINGIPFLESRGFHIVPGDFIEISLVRGGSVKVAAESFDKVKIEREGANIKITTFS